MTRKPGYEDPAAFNHVTDVGADMETQIKIEIMNFIESVRIGSLQKSMDKFAERFQKDPFDAFRWSQEAFGQAAQLKVWKEILHAMKNSEKVTIDHVLEEMHMRAWRAAKWPSRSTSMAANLCEQEEARACAEIYEEIKSEVALLKESLSK
jgi:hypothetical protein